MATYKVIQDIEAEDKLLGPLTLRQFIYASIVVVTGFIAFKLILVKWYLALPLIPQIVFFGLLAAPFGHDQPNEVWLLAKIRFYIKPRRRIWDQSGIKELVTVTAPKMIEKHYTNGLTQVEVHSRLRSLADTIDSRGWIIKNVNVNLYNQPSYNTTLENSDRLIDTSSLPKEVSEIDLTARDDILDAVNNPIAYHLDQLINASTEAHRLQVVQQMQTTKQSEISANWFAPTRIETVNTDIPTVPPLPSPLDEKALLDKIHAEKKITPAAYGHMRTIKPLSEQQNNVDKPILPNNMPLKTTMTPQHDPAILNLANNDDLDVATLARQANKPRKINSSNEIVISLR
ncbi:MAG: hypothetical protein NVS3B23_02280 [Candidatus Saccharimonadales bacterium]